MLSPAWQKIALTVGTVAALWVLMCAHLLPDRVNLRVGEVAPRAITATRAVIYVDTAATNALRQAQMRATPPVYVADDSAAIKADRMVKELFLPIERARAVMAGRDGRSLSARTAQVALVHNTLGPALSDAQCRYLLAAPPTVFDRLRTTTLRLVERAMDDEIREFSDDLRRAHDYIGQAARGSLPPADAAIVRAVADLSVRPNRVQDQRKTDAARYAAAAAVLPVYQRLPRGETISHEGERITQETEDKLAALGLATPDPGLTSLAICILAAVMSVLVAVYIARSLPELYADTRRLALLCVIVILSVFGLKVGASLLGLSFSGGQLGYMGMMTVAAAGMLVSVLLDINLAVLIVALLSIQSGLIMNHDIRFTILTMVSSLIGIFAIGPARAKHNLLTTTAILATANVGMVLLTGLLLHDLNDIASSIGWAIGSAAFATFLYWFGLLALERPFGILTHTALLELSATDRPLLKELCAVAPGTYAHSMLVGNLAEAGALAVGADALLCRVSGYYHDIGKMKRPEFFIENQRKENVHDRLSASFSALIITAHVRDGIRMAEEHRLPVEIRDIIAQHHGTTLIQYFYHQALADCVGSSVAPPGLEDQFRYPGPRPQTREAAIVMLADSVEAAARALDRPTLERLEAEVMKVVRGKLEDGQLDDCGLTFRDVKRISNAFLHVLGAMMHQRIEYPQAPCPSTTIPMEVVRPDLRPEPPSVLLHSLRSTTGLLPGEDLGAIGVAATVDSEVAREIAAHLRTSAGQDAEPEPAGQSEPAALGAVEQHLVRDTTYADLSGESVLPDKEPATAASGAGSARRGRRFRRRSHHPVDG